MPEAPTPASPLEALKAGFRRACVRRLVGDEGGAIEVLRDDIPSLVVNWAKSTSLEPSEKKAKLKEMFDDESGRADELAVAFDLFAGRFESRVAGLVRNEVGSLRDQLTGAVQKLSDALARVEQLSSMLSNASRLDPASSLGLDEATTVVENPVTILDDESHSTEELPKEKGGSDIERIVIPEEVSPDEVAKVIPITGGQPSSPNDVFVEDEALQSLDPPSGTGLRFDEIEEMIDEILSYESK
jgi:hypothetical protein